MDRCPLELWTKIAAFACTDGGYTGRSLSLVSHTMHSIVECVRYDSVSLSSKQRLFAFVARLSTLNKPPVIRHLLVTGARADPNLRMLQMVREQRAKIRDAVHAILSSVAPHLRTLTIHNWSSHNPVPDDVSFPLLEDATLTDVLWAGLAASMLSRFPVLRRLHILSLGRVDFHGLWDVLAESTPLLTHLRITDIASDTELPYFLRILLDIPPRRQDPSAPTIPDYVSLSQLNSEDVQEALAMASRLSALGYICVRPAIDGCNGYGCRNVLTTRTHQDMVLDLEDIARTAERGRSVGQFVLLPKHKRYDAEDARRDWLEAIGGGDGSWPGGSDGLVGPVAPSVRAKWIDEGNTFTSQYMNELNTSAS